MSQNYTSDRKTLEDYIKKEMEKTIVAFTAELQKVRTGRASASLLDDVSVDSYGSKMKLNKIANITTPEPKLIVVNPFDKTMLPVIEKAVQTAGLGLNPTNDGKLIRIPIPPLSEERRKEIVKQLKEKAENARVAIRNHRHDGNAKAKEAQENASWSKDDVFRSAEDIQKLTTIFNKKIDELLEKKEQEILTV
jgi:ribosome recycling factor